MSLKTRFAYKFVRSLSMIKRRQSRPTTTLFSRQMNKKMIKMASYSSMALAAGSKRVWSRSVIFKNRCHFRRRKRVRKEKNQFDMLRELVPGGEMMDLCKLLEETAHYIKCLGVQVKVMEKIVDACSTTTCPFTKAICGILQVSDRSETI